MSTPTDPFLPPNVEPAPSAKETRDRIARGETSCEAVIAACLDDLEKRNPGYHALLEIHAEEAMERARHLDKKLDAQLDASLQTSRETPGSARALPLLGVPVALKDNICLDRGLTTCASRMLEHYASPYTATAAARLEAAGAVVVGKANLDEFAMGSSCEFSAFGCSDNPWHPSLVPGGSSGGSASAVSAGLVPIALGSDTGGSIRQPASHCGVVGFKPTYGRVSRYGLVAFGSSLDQIGPMTRTVEDMALCFQAIAGHDPFDATTRPEPAPDCLTDLSTPVERLRLGVPTEARDGGLHPDVARVLESTIRRAQDAGVEIIDVHLEHADAAIAAYYVVASAEASSNLSRFDGVRYGSRAGSLDDTATLEDLYVATRSELFGPEVKRRILLGTHVLSSGYYDAYYNTALRARRFIKQTYDHAFRACDAILMPATQAPAFERGSKTDDPLAMYLEDLFTVGVNLAGLPAITLPAGLTEEPPTRPVGIQLIAPSFQDAALLRVAKQIESLLTA